MIINMFSPPPLPIKNQTHQIVKLGREYLNAMDNMVHGFGLRDAPLTNLFIEVDTVLIKIERDYELTDADHQTVKKCESMVRYLQYLKDTYQVLTRGHIHECTFYFVAFHPIFGFYLEDEEEFCAKLPNLEMALRKNEELTEEQKIMLNRCRYFTLQYCLFEKYIPEREEN